METMTRKEQCRSNIEKKTRKEQLNLQMKKQVEEDEFHVCVGDMYQDYLNSKLRYGRSTDE